MSAAEANLGEKETKVKYIEDVNADNMRAKERISELKAEIHKLDPLAIGSKSPKSPKRDGSSPAQVRVLVALTLSIGSIHPRTLPQPNRESRVRDGVVGIAGGAASQRN